jgi:hypothetical protein
MIEVLSVHSSPVIHQLSPGTEHNLFGFEGGTVIKHGGYYHLFTSEKAGEPMWVKMRLAHWRNKL